MKARILIDSTITAKAGMIVEIDEKEFAILKRFNRVEEVKEEFPKIEKREIENAEKIADKKRTTRKAKK